jgi:dCTP deaminase
MLLSHDEIEELIDIEVVEYAEKELINSTSLDVRLGIDILIERPAECFNPNDYQLGLSRVTLRDRDPLTMRTHNLMKDGPFVLYPGEFILAHTHEVFHLPNYISAQYALKSSMARIGLEHLNAGWCDAGWHGSSLTLELKNITRYHEIVLHHLDKIGQLVFFKHKAVKMEHSYATKGRYNGDRSVSGAKVDPRTELVVSEGDEELEFQETFNQAGIIQEEEQT